ncbi:hypothetical protein DPEC_G00251080 [Dallia pectoralis]|uniref:Uncharacterized protein n=1 Tax=Dallia pectoralis TaxID=75939 RepID=A0ACC2FTF4_DALPE|nr:hypothetical protein DPEC_G00251080 [Dallia pectoralis]
MMNAVQSKWTIIHLEGLNTKESAYSMPSRGPLSSGQKKAEPAYAASTCNQRPSSAPVSDGRGYTRVSPGASLSGTCA